MRPTRRHPLFPSTHAMATFSPPTPRDIQQRLWTALRSDDPSSARSAIEQGADIRIPEAGGLLRFPIHWAASHNTCGCLDLLLQAGLGGADLHLLDAAGRSPLFFASADQLFNSAIFLDRSKSRQDPARLPLFALLALGEGTNAQDSKGNTALHGAVRTDFMAAAEALIAHGADPRIPNHQGDTPLALAHTWSTAPMQRLLASAAELLDLKDATPLPAIARPSAPPRL